MSQNVQTAKKHAIISKCVIALIFIVVFFVLLALVNLMRTAVNSSTYSVRKELLGRLTESGATVISDNIEYGQSISEIFTESAEFEMSRFGTVESFLEIVCYRSGYENQIFFFVDEDGKYYSSDGGSGKIVDMTYYTDTSDHTLTYISSLPHLPEDKTYLIMRHRLNRTLTVRTEEWKDATLAYCGILFDIDTLNDTVSKEFSGANNTFIYTDENGVMLYKNFGIRLLMDGYNIYPKLQKATAIYGEDPTELENACRNRETVVVALDIGGEEYCFCSAPIEGTAWSLAFIVQTQYLDDISGNGFASVISYISLIALILGAFIVAAIIFFYKNALSQRSIRQITQLNTQLKDATNAKSDFLSNMSHDIRTPINGIMGMTTIARKVEGNPAKTIECLDKIDGASRHLLSLINDVLDMTRIERGKTEISAKPVDICTVVDNCSSIVRGQITNRALDLITEVDVAHPHLLVDDLHLRQILINILGNAVKFTKDGGTIWFRCKELSNSEQTVVISFEIEDTGIGMKSEFLPKIFDTFTQDEGGARSTYKGTGLGMAITKQLTELMGGSISVESELGKGSKFTVTIPFTVSPEEVKQEQEEEVPTDLAGIKILLVEDNPLNMDIATELLGDAGAVLTGAENGRIALETFANSAPGTFDVILMDIMMPEMNGLEATKAIRALDRADAQTIPILAMTANAFESDIQATFEAGMNAHLSKPININEVIKSVSYHVRKKA